MSSIYGIWKHEMVSEGSSTVTTHTIREDGSYETHMIFAMGSGCQQHIYHHGKLDIGKATLRLNFDSGKTEMRECEEPAKNFGMRDFTEEETNEVISLLEQQEIPYTVEGDKLTMTVKGPTGEMKVVYNRQVE